MSDVSMRLPRYRGLNVNEANTVLSSDSIHAKIINHERNKTIFFICYDTQTSKKQSLCLDNELLIVALLLKRQTAVAF